MLSDFSDKAAIVIGLEMYYVNDPLYVDISRAVRPLSDLGEM